MVMCDKELVLMGNRMSCVDVFVEVEDMGF